MSTALIRDGCHGFKVAALNQHGHHGFNVAALTQHSYSQHNLVGSGPKLVALTQNGLYGLRLSDLTKDGCHGSKVATLTPCPPLPRFIGRRRLLPRIPEIPDKVSDNALVNPEVRGHRDGAGPGGVHDPVTPSDLTPTPLRRSSGRTWPVRKPRPRRPGSEQSPEMFTFPPIFLIKNKPEPGTDFCVTWDVTCQSPRGGGTSWSHCRGPSHCSGKVDKGVGSLMSSTGAPPL